MYLVEAMLVDWLWMIRTAAIFVALPIAIVFAAKLYVRSTVGRCTSLRRLDGKVIVITGSNSGIGKKSAEALALLGAKVIMACRDVRKAQQVAEDIRALSPDCNVSVQRVDLCQLKSVQSFVDTVTAQEEKIDILINNAGIPGHDFNLTEDGFEEIYQANYLGPFYLTELLLPLLKKSSRGRIINTGSSAYLLGHVNPRSTFLTDVKTPRALSVFRYGDTKLAMLMWTRALADELKHTGISVNLFHPGVVSTPIATHQSLNVSTFLFRFIIFIFGRSPEEGAQTLLQLCLQPVGHELTGQYWAECKPTWVVKGNNKLENQALVQVTRQCLNLKSETT